MRHPRLYWSASQVRAGQRRKHGCRLRALPQALLLQLPLARARASDVQHVTSMERSPGVCVCARWLMALLYVVLERC